MNEISRVHGLGFIGNKQLLFAHVSARQAFTDILLFPLLFTPATTDRNVIIHLFEEKSCELSKLYSLFGAPVLTDDRFLMTSINVIIMIAVR